MLGGRLISWLGDEVDDLGLQGTREGGGPGVEVAGGFLNPFIGVFW